MVKGNIVFLVCFILFFRAPKSVFAQWDGKCTENSDCVSNLCHLGSRMCLCQNGASSYPSCTIVKGNHCPEVCSSLQYCDRVSEQCLCRYGGTTVDTCCIHPCRKYEVCNQGTCKCAYGKNDRGNCRRCKERCELDEKCVKRDGRYKCVQKPREWSNWSSWSKCSKTCGTGEQTRTRTCSVKHGTCNGESAETRPCYPAAPCTGTWGSWEPWSTCSKSCGGGTKTRARVCPKGLFCPGVGHQQEVCGVHPCIGNWGHWSAWSQCSKTCGGGTRTRTRSCENHLKCHGFSREEQACNLHACIGQWGPWEHWSQCSRTCDGGERHRSRSCPPGLTCKGGADEVGGCGAAPCIISVDCGWCPFKTKKQTIPGQCRFQEVKERTRNCPKRLGNGAKCKGQARIVKDITITGKMISRDFHSGNPEGNRFYARCAGGCISIHKVVHFCHSRGNDAGDLQKVKNVCEGKEVCSFTPAPSFFGHKHCSGVKKTWVTYSCNNGHLTTNHQDGPQHHHHGHGHKKCFLIFCFG